ncbi:MAG: glycine/sarcosine/betaine reductase component B subunit [Actinomycetota bacterium]
MKAPGFTGLRRHIHQVRSADFGDATALSNGHLSVAIADALACFVHPSLASVTLSWARPGDDLRVVKVLDAVEPRTKGPGGGGIFPGLIGPALPQGEGDTHVLKGIALLTAGYIPRAQQGVIQMSGPAAELSPFGATINLVVEFEPAAGASWLEVAENLRLGLLRLAVRLAASAIDTAADPVDQLPRVAGRAAGGGLPVIGTIVNLQTQGDFKDVYVYGKSLSTSLPTILDPNELEDGAVVSGQHGHPGLKNPTYMHQNNPVIGALRARDGVDLSFGGAILSPEPIDQRQKELVSAHAVRMVRTLGWDGAVVTKEGAGNADIDISLKVDALEAAGIVGVGIFAEMSGADGLGPPLVSAPAHATAVISTGNYDQRVTLPQVEKALGGATLELTGGPSTAQLELATAAIYCSLSPVGWNRLTAGVD